MTKFQSEFEFQVALQFYRTVETCDGNGQKFWQVPPSFQPSRFGYDFFMIEIQAYWKYKGTLNWPIKFSPKRI